MFKSGGGGDGDEEDALGHIPMMLSPGTTVEMSPVGAKGRGGQQQQPQWGQQETRELIAIRGELEKDFSVSKRNRTLWEVVSSRMRERGFFRTSDQCKCKWKNLVNRYKGKETSDPENGRECPFFEELQAVFTERTKSMQRLLLESEAGSTNSRKRVKRMSEDRSSGEFSDDGDNSDDSEEEKLTRSSSIKRKGQRILLEKSARGATASNANANAIVGVQEMLKDFLQQQQKMEMQWREMMERRAHERQVFEQEWRQSMEKLERERLMIEQAWREREEQRRIREESRAERRDALMTALLNKLIHERNI
ncbi:hypothetical protein K2173_002858 [Erythroxylum novogranatense]|uniref:Myb-like domain-containing protein n=1 Tax=Erythroxylum novogranatense TaxID=1862640 RepID=A0AAV8SQ46_9ROSI|nr:hypothetical protein K2173_002858 [Erythroxylum novogranatense]